ncbi:MAG: ribonuclease III [Myxococcota bacterium]
MSRQPTAFERRLGWTFRNDELLREALTHSTYANEHAEGGPDNERLEFLGDAVLDLIVSKILYLDSGRLPEGDMSRQRAEVVRREGLARLSENIDLRSALLLGTGQSKSGHNTSILADGFEAVVGAVFIDGGYEAAESCFAPALTDVLHGVGDNVDYKTRLQEACHQRGKAIPQYKVLSMEGPAHARQYLCEVEVEGEVLGSGAGSSKKKAEQLCAREALIRLGDE